MTLTLVVTALGALGWWRWWKTASHECEPVPQVLVPWAKPEHDVDRPPREYVTFNCPYPNCDVRVDVPVRTKLLHQSGLPKLVVIPDCTEIELHESEHPAWA
jgi:hypothetical protein